MLIFKHNGDLMYILYHKKANFVKILFSVFSRVC
nr:MAG TPA: hypothetical protein [Caudoviricetes sp.]